MKMNFLKKRRSMFILLTLCVGWCSQSAKAQWNVGAKVGINCSKVTESGYMTDLKSLFGAEIGGVLSYRLNEKWSFQGELMYNQMGFKVPVVVGLESADTEKTVNLKNRSHYLSLDLLGKFYPTQSRFNIQAGPQFSYLLDSSSKASGADMTGFEQNKFDLGIVAGLGYEWEMGLFVDARYVCGLSKCLKAFDSRNAGFQVSLGYLF